MTKPDPKRRDFLMISALGGVTVAVGAAGWGLAQSTFPGADQVAKRREQTATFDLSTIPEGAEVKIKLFSKPYVIRHRTKAEIEAARAVDLDTLIDRKARNAALPETAPATDENRSITPDGRYIAHSMACTHLGCIVIGEGSGDFGGFFCPCHAAHFDTSGRARKGPAPKNLDVPRYELGPGNRITLTTGPALPTDAELDRLIYGLGLDE